MTYMVQGFDPRSGLRGSLGDTRDLLRLKIAMEEQQKAAAIAAAKAKSLASQGKTGTTPLPGSGDFVIGPPAGDGAPASGGIPTIAYIGGAAALIALLVLKSRS